MGRKRASDIGVRTEAPDLEYRCHFIGPSGVIEGVHLFSSPDDASAALTAMEQLHLRARAMSVELWKGNRLIVSTAICDCPDGLGPPSTMKLP
jgi:hypothetical protein